MMSRSIMPACPRSLFQNGKLLLVEPMTMCPTLYSLANWRIVFTMSSPLYVNTVAPSCWASSAATTRAPAAPLRLKWARGRHLGAHAPGMGLAMRKYRNEPVVVQGIRFASKKEARRYAELLLLAGAGEIAGLRLQVVYPLVVNGQTVARYICDFEYHTKDGRKITEDTKGVPTPLFKLKQKLMRACYGIDVQVV